MLEEENVVLRRTTKWHQVKRGTTTCTASVHIHFARLQLRVVPYVTSRTLVRAEEDYSLRQLPERGSNENCIIIIKFLFFLSINANLVMN